MTVPTSQPSGQDPEDYKSVVVKALLYAVGGFISTLVTILLVAGQFEVDSGTVRLALVIACIMATVGLFTAAYIATMK
jgi:hypothetical protein